MRGRNNGRDEDGKGTKIVRSRSWTP